MKPPLSCYVGTGLVPVRGYEGQVVYTERVYIWVVGVAPDPDTSFAHKNTRRLAA